MTDKLISNVLMFNFLFVCPFCMYFGYATIKYTLFPSKFTWWKHYNFCFCNNHIIFVIGLCIYSCLYSR